jgi:hypothetical protein
MKPILLFGFCLLTLPLAVSAQIRKPDVVVKDIKLTLSPAPIYNLESVPTGQQQPKQDTSDKWLMIEVDLEPQVEWIEETLVKFYVVAQYAPDAWIGGVQARKLADEMQYDVLTTAVNVINLQKRTGHKNRVPVFLDPRTVKKYGHSSLTHLIPEVAVEVSSRGVVQSLRWMNGDERRPGRFWERKQPKAGILLNLLQSPWWPAYSEHYERIKPTSFPLY